MTAQQLYTKVRNHLLTQNAKAMRGGRHQSCAYRAEDGCKCAIGCLIPDTLYKPSFEGNSVCVPEIAEAAGLTFEKNSKGSATGLQLELAQRLQGIHDFNDPAKWRILLDGVAAQYKLIVET